MDIVVSRLNKRMALQLPAELPLGLVFVVGEVERLTLLDEGDSLGDFYLREGEYCLRCRLSKRAGQEVILSEGDMVRAGGHLAFEPTQAGYYLLARDVEVLREYRPARSVLSEIVAGTNKSSQAVPLAPAELPAWVRRLAPPEIRSDLAEAVEVPIDGPDEQDRDTWETFVEASMVYPAEEPALAVLSDDVIDFLSEAMDSPEEIELTPELIAELASKSSLGQPPSEDDPQEESVAELLPEREDGTEAGISVDDLSEQKEILEAVALSDESPESEMEPAPIAAVSAPSSPQVGVVEPPAAPAASTKSTVESTQVVPWYAVTLIVILFLALMAAMLLLALFGGA